MALGLETALTPTSLLYCVIGVWIGTLVGVLPGIGSLAALSMLFPLTLQLDPIPALVMLAGIYYGCGYGGSTASILLNVPGEPSSAVSCLDGYPMAKNGRAGAALLMSAVGSFVGGSVGIILMMAFSPLIVQVSLSFSSPEFFSLMAMGLVAASVISTGSPIKGLAMVVLGCLIGTVGVDTYTAVPRFTFGLVELMDGVSLVGLAMGLFGVTEVISSIRPAAEAAVVVKQKITLRSMLPTRDEVRRSWFPMLRGTAIGSFFGTLPGTGATIASFVSYGVEQRVAKDPSRFGHGAIEGVVAPKAADNSADQTAFIPTFTLGIPGTPSMALILGVLIMRGVAPGPTLMIRHPDLFWGLVMSFWIGNALLLILNIPLIRIWVRLLAIPYKYLYPSILVFISVGVLTVNYSSFDIILVIIVGILGYGMRLCDFPPAPLLLGYVLGPLMEEHFRRAMLVSHGSFDAFLTRPISATCLGITAALLIFGFWSAYAGRRSGANAVLP
jgi:TctA family transporter